jgi:NAD(P)-dependent dehydrogenase (short-subunit alcohol dehydrogenase family)
MDPQPRFLAPDYRGSGKLEGLAALVTGGESGIGRATTLRFVRGGVAVLGVDLNPDGLEETRSLASDLALVNNAGHAVFKPALETSLAEFQRTLDVNLTGPFLMIKAAVPLMRSGGAIVNITSISGLRASALRIAYGTSKAALAHLTKQLALELSVRGIRVNAVAPGPVDIAMAKAVHSAAIRADYHDAIPLGRYGLEEELAEAIFFLCSERASYITGQILAVDGGFDAIGIGLPTFRKDMNE